MKVIVTHTSPDWDAIASVWLIKKFLPGWEEAELKFVPAGERIGNIKYQLLKIKNVIEDINGNEVIHVDTGLGPLDHHQIEDESQSAASRTWEFVKAGIEGGERWEDKKAAIDRIVKIVVDMDHFKEVFWDNPTADYHEFSLLGFLDGLKLQKPNEDLYYINVGIQCLDALLNNFENRIWAENEIKEKGEEFETKWGRGIGFETINDTVLKLAQKMGYVVVVRKDPRKGYVRIKAKPSSRSQKSEVRSQKKEKDVDLTLVYEKLKKMDPEATWYLHVSKKMLLNGTPKNPKMIPTRLGLRDIIEVLKGV